MSLGKIKPIILSLGGSLVVPNGGINTKFLIHFNKYIRKKISSQKRRFFIVVGGGRTARHYSDAGMQVIGHITKTDLDWLGIHSTRLNAHLIRTVFQDIAHPRIIDQYEKGLNNVKEPLVIAAGWKPGWSTDYCAVLLAKDYGASTVVNLSNIDMVYSKDPRKYKKAKPIEKTSWEYFQTLVGTQWDPGLNVPFDPIASQLASKLGLTVVILKGDDFDNLDKLFSGRKFKGTVISPVKLDASFYNRDYFEGGKGEYKSGYTTDLLGRSLVMAGGLYRALTIKLFLKPKTLLDVGCATGTMIYFLRKMGVKAYGLEISKYAISRSHGEIRKNLKFGDICDIPFKDNSFDVVTTFDVLEHVRKSGTEKAISECNRVSKKYVLHKIYTNENTWIHHFHSGDISHVNVNDDLWWGKFWKKHGYNFANIYFPHLPQNIESIYLLEKNQT